MVNFHMVVSCVETLIFDPWNTDIRCGPAFAGAKAFLGFDELHFPKIQTICNTIYDAAALSQMTYLEFCKVLEASMSPVKEF